MTPPDMYKPPATYLLRALMLIMIAAPTIALGWTWFPEVHTSMGVAIGVTFAPFIPAWYFSARIQEWYVGSVNYKGVLLFHTIATATVPNFSEVLAAAGKKITADYAKSFITDESFRAQQMLEHIKNRIEEDKDDTGENGTTD